MTTYLDKTPTITERWNSRRYRNRRAAADLIAKKFNCVVSSGVRFSVPPGGSTTSLHLKSRGGLAFDFSGKGDTEAKRVANERRLCAWAAKHPGLFQEIMHHDVGGGLHAHAAFNGKVRLVKSRVRRALRSA